MIFTAGHGIGKGNLRDCSVASSPFLPEPAHQALTLPARSRVHAVADAVKWGRCPLSQPMPPSSKADY
jgi:hypothetical protein